MTMFLKLLIYELRTIDGNRGSGDLLIKQGVKQMVTKYGYVDQAKNEEHELRVRHLIMQKIWFNYSLLRVKQKISFSAMLENETIIELWGKNIIKSFRFLRDSGQIKSPIRSNPERKTFRLIMHGINDHCLKLLVSNYVKNKEMVNLLGNANMTDKISDQIKQIRDTSRCDDLFQFTKIGDYKMFDNHQPVQKLVRYRVLRKRLEKIRSIMQMFKALKAHSGFGKCTYIEIVLKEIEISKLLLIQDIYQGKDVVIPK